MEFTDDVRAYTSYSFKPQLKTVGPKYGKQLGNIRKALAEIDGNAAMDTLNQEGKLTFEFGGTPVELTRDDLLIDAAQVEGFVREIISKVQTMRKEAGFEVMDHIRLYHDGNGTIEKILNGRAEEIMGEVLADAIESGRADGYVKEWNINGETVTLGVEKVG